MISYKQASTRRELEQILQLQQKNLIKSLSAQEREKEGFLTVEHNFPLLKEMNDVCGHIIAVDHGDVVGYALCMHPKFGQSIDVLKPMFVEINKIVEGKSNYMVMGQICVAKEYRGKGIFQNLYQTMKNRLPKGFDGIITEVNVKNIRSMNAHRAIGFKVLKEYSSADTVWSLIVLSS